MPVQATLGEFQMAIAVANEMAQTNNTRQLIKSLIDLISVCGVEMIHRFAKTSKRSLSL
jgi:hypothetical protein